MRPVVLLFIALFNSILGLSVLFPIFGPLGRSLGLADYETTALSAAYALMQLLLAPAWGRRSERVGRKPVLLIGVIGFAVGFFAFGGVAYLGMQGTLEHGPLVALLILARLLGGAFSSATLPTAQAYAADVSERSDRTSAMAVIGAAFGLGVIFGPGIGAGLVVAFGGNLLAPVWFSASVAVVNALFIAWRLPEPERKGRGERPDTPLSEVTRRLWPILAVGLVATLSSVAMEQTLAFHFMDRLGITDEAEATGYVGAALTVYGIVAVIVQGFLVRRFKWSPLTLIRAGVPIAICGFILLLFAQDLAFLTVALSMQGIGQGLLMPGVAAAVSLGVSDDEQGAAAGVNASASGLGRLIGPLLAGPIYEFGKASLYGWSAGLLVIVLVVVVLVPQVVPRPKPA